MRNRRIAIAEFFAFFGAGLRRGLPFLAAPFQNPCS